MHIDLITPVMAPVLGLLASFYTINRKIKIITILFCLALLAPMVDNQIDFINPWVDNVLFTIPMIFVFQLLFYQIKKRIWIRYLASIFSVLIITFGIGYYAFFKYFGGDTYTTSYYTKDRYRYEYRISSAFSGRSVYFNRLYKTDFLHLYKKELDSSLYQISDNSCQVTIKDKSTPKTITFCDKDSKQSEQYYF